MAKTTELSVQESRELFLNPAYQAQKTFEIQQRMARNIKNGTAVMIPARKAVKFIPGKDLKKELQK